MGTIYVKFMHAIMTAVIFIHILHTLWEWRYARAATKREQRQRVCVCVSSRSFVHVHMPHNE